MEFKKYLHKHLNHFAFGSQLGEGVEGTIDLPGKKQLKNKVPDVHGVMNQIIETYLIYLSST